jgi:hypothetical protein
MLLGSSLPKTQATLVTQSSCYRQACSLLTHCSSSSFVSLPKHATSSISEACNVKLCILQYYTEDTGTRAAYSTKRPAVELQLICTQLQVCCTATSDS